MSINESNHILPMMKKQITLIFTVLATQIAFFAQLDCSEEMVWDLFYSITNSDDVDLPEGAEASFTVNDEPVDGVEVVFEIFAEDIFLDNTLCIEFISNNCPEPIITCQTGSLVDLIFGDIDEEGDWGDDWDEDWDDWGDDDGNDSTNGDWDDWGDDWDEDWDDWGDDWDNWSDSTDGDWDNNNDEDDYDGEGQGEVSSIESINSEINILLYPVPARDKLTVEGLPEGNWGAMIFDSYGRLVSNQVISNLQMLDLNTINNGCYSIHIVGLDHSTTRFIIQK